MSTASETAAPAKAAEPAQASNPWIVSPGFDVTWMLAGLWLLFGLLIAVVLGVEPAIAPWVGAFGVVLAIIHAWSTTWTVLGSPIFREARARRPFELYVVPALIMLTSIGIGIETTTGPVIEEGAGFSPRHWGYFVYLGSFVVFHFFHFGQQDFGVLSLYRQRMKQFSPTERKVDLYFARFVAMGCMPWLNLEVFANSPFRAWLFSWLPMSPELLSSVAAVAFVGALTAMLGALGFELRKENSSLPKMIYMLIIGLHAITLYAGNLTGFALVYVYSHWLIAIALSWRVNRNHNVASSNPGTAWRTYALGFGACIALSLSVHMGLSEFGLFSEPAFRDYVGKTGLWMGIVMGFILGEQLTHYYYDRVLFKFSDPFVRENVGPLLR